MENVLFYMYLKPICQNNVVIKKKYLSTHFFLLNHFFHMQMFAYFL